MSNLENIAELSGAQIAKAYRSGVVNPVEVTEFFLDRIARSRSDNVFVEVCSGRALAEAVASRARYADSAPLSPLDGVPVAWKDNFSVATTRTRCGSRLFDEAVPASIDAPCVENVSAAGMVSLGKLNMSELAFSGLGLNPHYGTPVNPRDRTVHRSPGGSSSGCGVAVAARLVPVAIGTDTGGSIRVPASFNGIVGYKPSTGRIDTSGLVVLSRTLDSIGPLAGTVEDCVLTDAALRRAPSERLTRPGLSQLCILVPNNVVLSNTDPAVAANFENSVGALSRAGVRVRRERVTAFEDILALNATYGTILAAEAFHEYHHFAEGGEAWRMDQRVVNRLLAARKMTAGDLIVIQRNRARLIDEFREQLGDALLAAPTTPITAPPVGPLEADVELFSQVHQLTLRNVSLGNYLDLCAVALPNGADAAGLPTSAMFCAPSNADSRLLASVLEFERVLREAR